MRLENEMDEILVRHGIETNQLLDQSFMIDEAMIKKIVSTADIQPNESVVEIGAGIGFVSRELAKTGARIVSIDIDPKLEKILKSQLKGTNVRVVLGNALKFMKNENFDKIVSNTPYSITEPLIKELAYMKFKQAYLSVPKKFAYRLLKRDGVGMFAQIFFDVEILFDIPKKSFKPSPNVNTVFIKIEHRSKEYYKKHIQDFILKELLLQKTKKLRNAIIEATINLGKMHGKKMTKNESKDLIKGFNLNNTVLENKINHINLKMLVDIIKPLNFKVISYLTKIRGK